MIQFMSKGYDSVTSCNKIRKIFLKDKKFKPINFKFKNQHARTQNLNPLYVLNSAFLYSERNYEKLNRISKK